MDIAIFPEGNRSNIGPDFMKENPGAAIPYLTILSICMVAGTFGNLLVICSVLIDKVCNKNFTNSVYGITVQLCALLSVLKLPS